jgi:hypothetical protein
LVGLKDNLEWLDKTISTGKYHKNQFVAIKGKSFLDKDIELDTFVKRLKVKNFSDSIAIEYVYG